MTLRIIITGGTDTMTDAAAVLGQAFAAGDMQLAAKRIVLTGAMVPYSVSGSDALFNLGGADMASQLMPPGIYITMNGQCFHWNDIRKNREQGVFEGTAIFG